MFVSLLLKPVIGPRVMLLAHIGVDRKRCPTLIGGVARKVKRLTQVTPISILIDHHEVFTLGHWTSFLSCRYTLAGMADIGKPESGVLHHTRKT